MVSVQTVLKLLWKWHAKEAVENAQVVRTACYVMIRIALTICTAFQQYFQCLITRFYRKLGSGHSTNSFLISKEILSIVVLKVSSLVSLLTPRQICFLTFKTS